jgi:hypothetical protein
MFAVVPLEHTQEYWRVFCNATLASYGNRLEVELDIPRRKCLMRFVRLHISKGRCFSELCTMRDDH